MTDKKISKSKFSAKSKIKSNMYKSLLLFSCQVMSDSLWPHGLQYARPPCPSPFPGGFPSSCPLNQWCYPTVSSSVTLFSSCLQSFPASGSFPSSPLCIRWPKYWSFSFSVSPSNAYSGLIFFRIDWLALLAVQGTLKSLLKHQFFGAQLSLWSNSHIHTWLLERP